MPKIALRGREGLKLKAIQLQGKNLAVEIGLLRLSDSPANSTVGAFTALAKATVPNMIKNRSVIGNNEKLGSWCGGVVAFAVPLVVLSGAVFGQQIRGTARTGETALKNSRPALKKRQPPMA